MLSVVETSSDSANNKIFNAISPFLMCFTYSITPLRHA